MAHKKGAGSTRNGRDSAGQRLGVKEYAGSVVDAGAILVRQRGGGLEVVVGSMFSGKSEELIRRMKRAVIARRTVQVFKPAIDDRFGSELVRSHDGDSFVARPVRSSGEIVPLLSVETSVVGVDEVQFFDPGIVGVVRELVASGRRTIGLACRKPDEGIYRYREALDSPLLRSRTARAPFVRGVFVLWESLRHGMRMLMRSADVQLARDEQPPSTGSSAFIGVGLVVALVLFVGVPYVATGLLRAILPSTLWQNVAEGILRLALLLGYLVAISFLPDIRRVFAYHGAEHMTIHAFEHGDPLDARHITPYPTAHPRCGTAFLLFVVVIAIAVFAFVPRVNLFVDLAVRLVLVLPVASLSYEVLKLGAGPEGNPLMRLAVAPGLLLQAITTRRPDEPMIEVAIASLEEALAGDAAP